MNISYFGISHWDIGWQEETTPTPLSHYKFRFKVPNLFSSVFGKVTEAAWPRRVEARLRAYQHNFPEPTSARWGHRVANDTLHWS